MTEPTAYINVRWPKSAASKDADHNCVIGQDINIKPEVLQDFSATILKPVEQDLVVLAGAVAFADRKVRRQRSKGWARNIKLQVPVQNIAKWKEKAVRESLIDVLDWVTGDRWEFDFVKDPTTLVLEQSSLDFTRGNYVVVPFSDGMDSYLQWQLLKKEEPDVNVLRVHTSSRASNKARNGEIDSQGSNSDQRLAMPVSLAIKDHAERSYRTRTFLFYTIAGLAAHKVGAKRVVVGENGVGTFGPSMARFGDECPHRTTHPAFTRRLAAFLNRVMNSSIIFEHPQQYLTKGQVLQKAANLGISGWEKTHSCTRGSRSDLGGVPCGICGGCLLRRTATHAAGLPDVLYFWDDLSHAELDECRSIPTGRDALPNDEDIARHGIADMAAFAEFGASDQNLDVFEHASWEIFGRAGRDTDQAAIKLAQLAQTHALEWSSFENKFDVRGFIRRQQES